MNGLYTVPDITTVSGSAIRVFSMATDSGSITLADTYNVLVSIYDLFKLSFFLAFMCVLYIQVRKMFRGLN